MPKKFFKNKIVRNSVFSFVMISFLGSVSSGPLFKIGDKDYEFKGLTEEGVQIIKEARKALLQREKLFNLEFKQAGTFLHAATVARLGKNHMFIYGPAGGAKSSLVEWMFKGESYEPFKIQMHQMMSEQPLIGGQNFEVKDGSYKINTKGSLTNFKIALIDEIDKSNPASLSPLLSILNERKVLAGSQVINAEVETVYSTSNSNLPELFRQFSENGMGSTVAALLNRFQFKAFIYNWLSVDDQADLDELNKRRKYLKSIADDNPEVLKDMVFLPPEKLPWPELRKIAMTLFTPSDLLLSVSREFVAKMREDTLREIRESEARNRLDPEGEPFVYFPSADYTERLRQQIIEIVILSAFVDFLMSPLAADDMIASTTKKQLALDPVSLWRSSLILTTIGQGKSRLVINPQSKDKPVNVDFGYTIDPTKTRDQREEFMIKNLQNEQKRFNNNFQAIISNYQSQIKIRAEHSFEYSSSSLNTVSLEQLILKK